MAESPAVLRVGRTTARVEFWCPCGAALEADRPPPVEAPKRGQKKRRRSPEMVTRLRCPKCGKHIEVRWETSKPAPTVAVEGESRLSAKEIAKRAPWLSWLYSRSDRSR
jgi:hypothetical protein